MRVIVGQEFAPENVLLNQKISYLHVIVTHPKKIGALQEKNTTTNNNTKILAEMAHLNSLPVKVMANTPECNDTIEFSCEDTQNLGWNCCCYYHSRSLQSNIFSCKHTWRGKFEIGVHLWYIAIKEVLSGCSFPFCVTILVV
jgi:hypothetical protein